MASCDANLFLLIVTIVIAETVIMTGMIIA